MLRRAFLKAVGAVAAAATGVHATEDKVAVLTPTNSPLRKFLKQAQSADYWVVTTFRWDSRKHPFWITRAAEVLRMQEMFVEANDLGRHLGEYSIGRPGGDFEGNLWELRKRRPADIFLEHRRNA